MSSENSHSSFWSSGFSSRGKNYELMTFCSSLDVYIYKISDIGTNMLALIHKNSFDDLLLIHTGNYYPKSGKTYFGNSLRCVFRMKILIQILILLKIA